MQSSQRACAIFCSLLDQLRVDFVELIEPEHFKHKMGQMCDPHCRAEKLRQRKIRYYDKIRWGVFSREK